ncbi:MAG: type II toxin-antitoxin system HicA family toxin [Gammaproteobacteria bacterium]|nr:type II toxin-antitoxin system HicA family toxin [Gammaproteobacteria bacterium]
MARLTPLDWRKLVRLFEADGFTKRREKGSHIIMDKPGADRPVVIPKYSDVGVDIIKSNMRTAGMPQKRFFDLLKDC